MDEDNSHSTQGFPVDFTQLLQCVQSGASISWKEKKKVTLPIININWQFLIIIN